MKKISLFFILTLFTFSLSAKMETKYLKINYSGRGILEDKKLQEHFKSNLKSTNRTNQKTVDKYVSELPDMDKSAINDMDIKFNPGKPISIKSMVSMVERLNEDIKYYQFFAYNYEAIIEVLPSIVRQCKQFLFFKQCKNVKVNPSVTNDEIHKFVNKEIMPKVYNKGKVHLPTENYSKFSQIYQKSEFFKSLLKLK